MCCLLSPARPFRRLSESTSTFLYLVVRFSLSLFFLRGEIIGNAVADKREKLYENMQIGSDYMFRVDEVT